MTLDDHHTLILVAVANLIVQDSVGVGLASLMGYPPATGLLAGSATLSGGHGTVLAWGPIISEKFGIPGASAMGAAAATFGLIAGGRVGGPLGKVGFTLPKFVTALFSGMVLSNTVPRLFPKLGWPTGSPPLALIADVALGLFLAMSLMTLNLASLAGVALPLFFILAVQAVVCWLLVSHVVFRLLGGTYDAAVTSSGYFGLAMGATPTAIAIMTATTKKCGASLRSFLVVPLVGAFFVDIANAIVLQTFVKVLGG